jgi:hypothetical protein
VGSAGFAAGALNGDTLLDALQYGGGSDLTGATQISCVRPSRRF